MQKPTASAITAPKEKWKFSRLHLAAIMILLVIPAIIVLGITVWDDRKYYLVSGLIIAVSSLPFVFVFEKRKPQARELVLIASITALAVAGRAAFYMTPQFKPIVAIVIIGGVSLGGEAGFLIGAVGAFVSNFFFSQGPWTPWQMFSMGIIGFLAGVIFHGKKAPPRWQLCLYGGLSTFFIYGILMDTASLFMFSSTITKNALLAMYLSGVTFNLVHAVATVLFLAVLSRPLLKKIGRIKTKFGMLEETEQ